MENQGVINGNQKHKFLYVGMLSLGLFFNVSSLNAQKGTVKTMKNATVIYLNGPSSAGKTTLARALQNKLKEPFLLLGIDQFIFMMPEKVNNFRENDVACEGFYWEKIKDSDGSSLYKICTGPFGKRVVQAFRETVITLAKSGFNIIIDDVSFGKQQVDVWKDALQHFNVLWIGVTAPVKVIEQREKERNDRKIGSAKWQALHVHNDVIYDLMIDTHKQDIDTNVNLVMQHLNSNEN